MAATGSRDPAGPGTVACLRLASEAQLGVVDAVDRARPGQVGPALVVDRVRLEVEQFTVAAASRALRTDGPGLDGRRVDGLGRRECGAAVGALEVGLEPLRALGHRAG